MGNGVPVVSSELLGFALSWLVQSSVLLTLGLLAGGLLRRSGPAVHSCVYRTTLAAVLICPFASAALGIAGLDGFSLRLPARTSQALAEPVASGASEAIGMIVQPIAPARAPREAASPVISACAAGSNQAQHARTRAAARDGGAVSPHDRRHRGDRPVSLAARVDLHGDPAAGGACPDEAAAGLGSTGRSGGVDTLR